MCLLHMYMYDFIINSDYDEAANIYWALNGWLDSFVLCFLILKTLVVNFVTPFVNEKTKVQCYLLFAKAILLRVEPRLKLALLPSPSSLIMLSHRVSIIGTLKIINWLYPLLCCSVFYFYVILRAWKDLLILGFKKKKPFEIFQGMF
jgi:hypothetical protein